MCQTFVDEKGYLVTEMVTEEMEGEESEVVAVVAPVKKETSIVSDIIENKLKKKSVATANAEKEKGKPQQKSMMSFFGKK